MRVMQLRNYPQKRPETPRPGLHPLPSGPYAGDTGARAVRSARRAVTVPHPEIRQGKTWRLVFGLTLPPGTRRRAAHKYTLPTQRATTSYNAASEKSR